MLSNDFGTFISSLCPAVPDVGENRLPSDTADEAVPQRLEKIRFDGGNAGEHFPLYLKISPIWSIFTPSASCAMAFSAALSPSKWNVL